MCSLRQLFYEPLVSLRNLKDFIITKLKEAQVDQIVWDRVSLLVKPNAILASDPTRCIAWLDFRFIRSILLANVILPTFDVVSHLACTPLSDTSTITDSQLRQPMVDLNHLIFCHRLVYLYRVRSYD